MLAASETGSYLYHHQDLSLQEHHQICSANEVVERRACRPRNCWSVSLAYLHLHHVHPSSKAR